MYTVIEIGQSQYPVILDLYEVPNLLLPFCLFSVPCSVLLGRCKDGLDGHMRTSYFVLLI